jgi:hypothetical protein
VDEEEGCFTGLEADGRLKIENIFHHGMLKVPLRPKKWSAKKTHRAFRQTGCWPKVFIIRAIRNALKS